MERASLALILIVVCLGSFGHAQDVPSDLLAEAEKKFREAFEGTYGKPPAKEDVEAALRQFERQVQDLPTQLGRQAGQQAARMDQIASAMEQADGAALLRGLQESPAALRTIKLNKEDVARLAGDAMPREVFDGKLLVGQQNRTAGNRLAAIKPDTEIRFPAGSFQVDERTLTTPFIQNPLPRGITIAGAGKVKTLLTIGDISFHSDVHDLTFRDLTLHSGNDGLFDLRRGSLTVRMQNVRVIGFDAGHGGCYVFSSAGGSIIHATDCDFLGGFGSSPGHGSLFRTNPLLGYFQDCRFLRIEDEIFRSIGGNSRLWLEDCTLDSQPRNAENIEFINCSFARDPGDQLKVTLEIAALGPFDPERPTRGKFVLTPRKGGPYGTSAFSFRHVSQELNEHRNYVDLVYQQNRLYVNVHGGQHNAIADMGQVALDDLTELPLWEFTDRPVTPREGHSYIQKVSCDGLLCFVKFRIVKLTQEDGLEIEWKMFRDGDLVPAFNNKNRGAAGVLGGAADGGAGGAGANVDNR